MHIVGFILAGGKSTRMHEEDKGLVQLQDQPLIAHVASVIKPRVKTLAINCNRNFDDYNPYADELVPDLNKNFDGPLAGIAAGMQKFNDADALLVATCDSPFLPDDFTKRLMAQYFLTPDSIILAETNEKIHPLHGIYPLEFADSINEALANGQRGVFKWLQDKPVEPVVFEGPDYWFNNVNSPGDLKVLENLPLTK